MLSLGARIGYGILLPLAVFIAWQAFVILFLEGIGGWEGIGSYYLTLVLVPILLVAGCWVLPIPWRRKHRLFLAGLALPAAVAIIEQLY